MLNDKEQQFAKEVERLQRILNLLPLLPKESVKDLERQLSENFRLDLHDIVIMSDVLKVTMSDVLKAKKDDSEKNQEDSIVQAFFDEFNGGVKKEKDAKKTSTKPDPDFVDNFNAKTKNCEPKEKSIVEATADLNRELSTMVHSEEFDNLLATVAHATRKMFINYRLAGFSEDESVQLVTHKQVNLHSKEPFKL